MPCRNGAALGPAYWEANVGRIKERSDAAPAVGMNENGLRCPAGTALRLVRPTGTLDSLRAVFFLHWVAHAIALDHSILGWT